MGDWKEFAIKALTTIALGGLVFSAGLQLHWRSVAAALARCPKGKVIGLNFLGIPALAFVLVRVFAVPDEIAQGILLLGAAPFAPVVPTFVRMAKGDPALAAALTGLIPFLSAVLTPLICAVSLNLHFQFGSALALLLSTITAPLAAGLALHHFYPGQSQRTAKWIQVVAEGAGLAGLILVVATQITIITGLGWRPVAAVGILSELSFLAGWWCGGADRRARMVVAFGSSNRNIALALLIAAQNFPATGVMGSVAGCGIVLILLGLTHVARLRFAARTT